MANVDASFKKIKQKEREVDQMQDNIAAKFKLLEIKIKALEERIYTLENP